MVLDLIGAEGTEDLRDHATIDGDTLAIQLPGDVGHGTYGLGWRDVSADDHPVSRMQLFVIREPGAALHPGAAPESRPHGAICTMRVVFLAGLVIGLGGVFFS